MHEIITLQLGQLSNYAATHFWNTQESYFTYSGQDQSPVNHDVHWRSGVALDGSDTFLPRTVVYDLKGGFGSLRKINALYDASDDETPAHLWEGAPQVFKHPQIDPSAYQKSLDLGTYAPAMKQTDVRYWSDYSRVFYHPKSLNQLHDYELNSSIMPFDKNCLGRELFDALDKEHDIVDRDVRPFVEEADQMQGLQLMTTIDDAWGGFASEYLERLRDEYGKVTIWAWGLQSPVPTTRVDHQRLQMANTARAVKDLCENVSMLVPLALPQTRFRPNIDVDLQSPWHTAALLSTAMETAGIASRLNTHAYGSGLRATLSHLVSGLNLRGKQTMSRLQMSVGNPTRDWAVVDQTPPSKLDADNADDAELDIDFFDILRKKTMARRGSPHYTNKDPHFFGRSITTRGFSSASDKFEEQRSRQRGALLETSIQRYHTNNGFPLIDSFPRVFLDHKTEPFSGAIGIKTQLSTDTSVSVSMKALRLTVASSIGLEDREHISNELADLAEAYREGWSSGSDDDDE